MILPSLLRCTAVAIILVGARRDVPVFAAASTYPAQASPPQKSPQTQPQPRTQKLANPLNDLLEEAQHDIDANQFEAALTPLEKFLAEKPEIAWAHFQLAYAYTALKRTDEALAEYQRVTTLDPKMSEAFLNLGMLLSEKDPAAAVVPLRRAVDLLPAQSRPRFLLGHALERSGDIPGAVDCYEAALRLDPRDVETIIHLGNLYVGLKRYSEAETKFRAGLELEPKSPQALLGLAETLDLQKKPEAAAALRDYLAVQPDAPGAQSRVIHLLLEQKQYEAALTELDRADAGKAPTLDSLRSRADIQIAQKKWDDAILTLRKAITLAPRDAELRGGLGRVFMQKRDFASAEKEIKVALEMDRNNLVYWKDLRSTYYLGGNYSATLATQDLIAKVETPGAGEWFIRALCYDKLNQPRPALEAYEKFLELDQDKNPNQVWQAQQRSKVLRRMLDQKR
jgi:tetratricopeptide (TPR) repeat protein